MPISNQEASFYIKRQIQLICRQINSNSSLFRVLIEQHQSEEVFDFKIHFKVYSLRIPITEVANLILDSANSIYKQLNPIFQKLGFTCSYNTDAILKKDVDSTLSTAIVFHNVFDMKLNSVAQKKMVRYAKNQLSGLKRNPVYYEFIKFTESYGEATKTTTFDITNGKFLDKNKHQFQFMLDLFIVENRFKFTYGDELSTNPTLKIRYVTKSEPIKLRQNIVLAITGTLSHKCINYDYKINCFSPIPTLHIYNSKGMDVTQEFVSNKNVSSLAPCMIKELVRTGTKSSIKASIKRKLNADVIVDNVNISNIKQNCTLSNFTKFKKIKLITNHSEFDQGKLVLFEITKNGIEAYDLFGQPLDPILIETSQTHKALLDLISTETKELFNSNRLYTYELIKLKLDEIDENFEFFKQIYFA